MKPIEYPDDDPPPYSESVRPHAGHWRKLEEHQNRPDLVHSVLTSNIIPHIHTATSAGVQAPTLVLVPSDVVSLQSLVDADSKAHFKRFPGEKLVGFPSTEELKLIRLVDPGNTSEYWQRLASKQSLAEGLHAFLFQEGFFFREDVASAEAFENLTGIPSDLRSGWMTVNEERLRDREASVNVSMQEVCLRVEDDMGLYETKRGKALVIRVRLGLEDSTLV